MVVDHCHAIRLTDTAVNQILAAQKAPRHRDHQLLLRGLSGRVTEPHGCEDASTLGGVEPLIILNDSPRVIVEKDKEVLEDRDFCYPEDHKAQSSRVKSDAPICP